MFDDFNPLYQRHNVLSLGSFLTLHNGEFYSLTFIKVLITFADNRVEVNENVSSSVTLDKAVAF
jgi:hypothetical protein